MTIASSFLRLSAIATLGILVAACSSAQTWGNIAPAAAQPATIPSLGAATSEPAAAQKCEHSRGFAVVPCRLTFTHRSFKQIFLHGAQGSGDTQEVDNCSKLATIGDLSGPIYGVKAKKAMGTCAAVFTHDGKFAILSIVDQL
jgi:hypothetical protein